MADSTLSGIGHLEEMAKRLLHAKGPQSLLVCSTTGLPILYVNRTRESEDLEDLAAWAAELANTTYWAAEQLNHEKPRRVELKFDSKALLMMLDHPFILLVTFPPESGKDLGSGREEKIMRLLESLHEELN